MLLDCHGLQEMHNNLRDNTPIHPYFLSLATDQRTFSLAFSLEGASIQLNSSSVSTYAFWILLMRSLTCERVTQM